MTKGLYQLGTFNLDTNSPNFEKEAERAIKHFIWSIENGYHFSTDKIGEDLRVSPELLKFIMKGVKELYFLGEISVWTHKKAGQASLEKDSYINMLAWYRFHIDQRFSSFPKTMGDGRYFKIAESFNESDPQSRVATTLSDRPNCIKNTLSESSIKRMIANFQKEGLLDPKVNSTSIHNTVQTEIFCDRVLTLPRDKIYAHSQEIIKCWLKNNKAKKQVQK